MLRLSDSSQCSSVALQVSHFASINFESLEGDGGCERAAAHHRARGPGCAPVTPRTRRARCGYSYTHGRAAFIASLLEENHQEAYWKGWCVACPAAAASQRSACSCPPHTPAGPKGHTVHQGACGREEGAPAGHKQLSVVHHQAGRHQALGEPRTCTARPPRTHGKVTSATQTRQSFPLLDLEEISASDTNENEVSRAGRGLSLRPPPSGPRDLQRSRAGYHDRQGPACRCSLAAWESGSIHTCRAAAARLWRSCRL
jgi:hypothetical protein